jgi:hypothetical protein
MRLEAGERTGLAVQKSRHGNRGGNRDVFEPFRQQKIFTTFTG